MHILASFCEITAHKLDDCLVHNLISAVLAIYPLCSLPFFHLYNVYIPSTILISYQLMQALSITPWHLNVSAGS